VNVFYDRSEGGIKIWGGSEDADGNGGRRRYGEDGGERRWGWGGGKYISVVGEDEGKRVEQIWLVNLLMRCSKKTRGAGRNCYEIRSEWKM